MREEVRKTSPERMLSQHISLADIQILWGMLKGKSYEVLGKELGVSKGTVINRVKTLEEKRVIVNGKRQVPIIDPVKIYNNVMITLIKLHLAAAYPPAAPYVPAYGPSPVPPAWLTVIDKLREASPDFERLVRFAFTLIGTEWDVALLITTQSMHEYTKFMNELQAKTGLIDKVWGFRVIETAAYYFDPINIPDPQDIKEALKWTKESSEEALGTP